jgi:hypothetical protein
MASTIQNRAKHLLVLPLNSGGTLHLAPGETSSLIEDFELENNEKVERLLKEGLIAVTKSGDAPPGENVNEGEPGEAKDAGGKERRRGGSEN